MPACQFQRYVTVYFADHSRVVAKWPLPFLLLPVIATGLLCAAFVTHIDNLANSGAKNGDKLAMFLPDDVPAVRDLKELSELFPPKDAIRDRYDMFGATFAYVVLEDVTFHQNVLRNYPLLVANDLNLRVADIKVRLDSWYEASFKQLCFHNPLTQSCVQHPLVFLLNSSDPMGSVRYFLNYPSQVIGEEEVDNTMIFGSVVLQEQPNGRKQIKSAKALRLAYVLRTATSPAEKQMLTQWQNEFIELIQSLSYPGINLYYTSAVSWSQEIERNGAMILPYMPLLFIVLFLFSVCSCCTADWVVSKPWLAICGIFNAFFAIAATMGTLVVVGYPFLTMVFIMPFLIMSISVDNMFLMLNSWRATHPLNSVEDRMAKAMSETSVSIMITALTDGLSFSVGSISKFPAVRVFCTYCALAILYVFLYQMTFFLACMALLGRREAANRHCITLNKCTPSAQAVGRPWLYRLLCTGGMRSSGGAPKTIPAKLDEQLVNEFFSTTYANLLKVWAVKAVVCLTFVVYLGGCVYGLLQLPVGLDLKVLVPRDSYLSEELEINMKHFSAYGGYGFCVTRGTEIKYYDPAVNRHVLNLYYNLTHTRYTDTGDFWLVHFNQMHSQQRFKSEDEFLNAVGQFLQQPQYARYASDIRFDEYSGSIEASKMLIRMRNVGLVNHTSIVQTMRSIFNGFGLPGFIYESSFLLVDQQQSTIESVMLNVMIATCVMILIAILFMPHVITAVWIGVSVLSINVGVVGGLALWDVRLDIVSMITIVMSIGFSVDFAAHITYHFMVAKADKQRLNRAMKFVGTPVLQAAASTALGVMSLAPVDSYMVRTFVKTVVLVVGLGMLHGLVFLPVFLSMLAPASAYLENLDTYRELGEYIAQHVPRYLHQIKGRRMQCYQAEAVDNRALNAQIRADTMGGATALSTRNKLGGLHASKRYPKMASDSVVPSQPRRANANDLYAFLKYKRKQQREQAEAYAVSPASGTEPDEVYSQPFSHSNNSDLPSSTRTADSDLPLLRPQPSAHRQRTRQRRRRHHSESSTASSDLPMPRSSSRLPNFLHPPPSASVQHLHDVSRLQVGPVPPPPPPPPPLLSRTRAAYQSERLMHHHHSASTSGSHQQQQQQQQHRRYTQRRSRSHQSLHRPERHQHEHTEHHSAAVGFPEPPRQRSIRRPGQVLQPATSSETVRVPIGGAAAGGGGTPGLNRAAAIAASRIPYNNRDISSSDDMDEHFDETNERTTTMRTFTGNATRLCLDMHQTTNM